MNDRVRRICVLPIISGLFFSSSVFAFEAVYNAGNNSVEITGENNFDEVAVAIMPYEYTVESLSDDIINSSGDILFKITEAGGKYADTILLSDNMKEGKYRVTELIDGNGKNSVFIRMEADIINGIVAAANSGEKQKFTEKTKQAFGNLSLGLSGELISQLANKLYLLKPNEGYTVENFCKSLTALEGLMSFRSGLISFENYMEEYAANIDNVTAEEYNNLTAEQKAEIESCAAGKAAKGEDSLFTVDVEIKLDDTGSTAMEWNFGLGNLSAQYLNGAYVTVNPSKLDNSGRMTKYGNSDFAVNGTRSVAKTFKQTIPGEDIIGNYSRLHANAWNTYRFITRKDENGNYYADLYINGAYFYQVGARIDNKYAGGAQNCFLFTVPKNAIKPGASIDNIKFYYGAVESDEYVTKGEFTIDRYTFDECAVGVNRYEGSENSAITFVGEDANHAFGVMKRYNEWNMNLDIESGKAGKSESDNSLSVHSGGRVAFANVNNDQGGNTAAYSTKYGTWVPEGDSLEFSADVLFKDIDENWLFQLESAIKDDYQDIAIEITPNFYSLGDWEDVDDFKNHRQRIAPKLPLNTWVNIRVIITRGTNDTFNKITIYADDNVICENQDITTWYTATNTTTDDGKTVVVYGEPRKGDILSKGLGKIYFHGECDYDNITIKKYLLGQEFTKPSSVPVLVNPTTKVDEYPSLRGKVYTDGRSIQSVIDTFEITGDYVVRDADGKEVTDYTKVADGNYIEFFANGKKYYGAFAANNVVETINETAGDLGGFTFDEAVVSVEAVTKGQGRDANDTSIQLTNNSEAEAIDDTQRFIKALNTDENAYMEFSFLADENTDFYVGYNVYYVRNGNTEGYSTKLGASRGYYDHIHIADNEVRSTNGDNGKKLVGTYKDGEWTKVRLEWNSMNNNAVAVSVNDSKKVLLNAGPVSYFKTIRNITITPAANTSVVLDDVLVMEGYKAAPEAAAVIDVTADYVYNKENKLSVPFEMGNSFMAMSALASSIEVSPAGSSKKWIKADGSKAEERTDEVDKLVLVNDGVYTYYPVVVREGITEFKNADGTSMMVIDVTNENIADLSGSKLISAVYDKESGKLVSAVMNDITFAEDSYTGEVNIMPQKYDAETQTMKYFAWKLSDMMSLCDALEYSK